MLYGSADPCEYRQLRAKIRSRPMYRKCVTELSAQHQQTVTECLLGLMQKQSYECITVSELCRTANISRRIFYH